MQAEHGRGNGFIISPLSVPLIAEKPKKKSKPRAEKGSRFIGELIKDFLSAFSGEWTYIKKSVIKSVFSTGAVVFCIVFFCSFFTVGTAIYKGNKLIGYTASEKEYSAALSAATEYAHVENTDINNRLYKTVPAFTLRSNLCDSKALADKILVSTGSFDYGCTLYSGEEAIFTAENEDTARQVLRTYLSSYSLYGEASPDASLSYKTRLLPKNEISSSDICSTLLANSGKVPVVSIASSSSQKEIPYETETRYDNDLFVGEFVTVTEGKSGSSNILSESVYRNGNLETVRVLSENVVTEPVTQVVRVGTRYKDVLKSGLLYPLTGTLSSPFGERWGRMHEGIDIATPVGTSVKAAECGVVVFADNAGSYGNLVRIDHGNGVMTAYAHLDSIGVYVGQAVNPDTEIAKSGNTGRSTGPHLHFEVVKDGVPLNPNTYLKKR